MHPNSLKSEIRRVVQETGTGIVQETGTGIVQETGTGISRSTWLAAAVLAVVLPISAGAGVSTASNGGYLVATSSSDVGGQVMVQVGAQTTRLSWFATLDNGTEVILSGFGSTQDNLIHLSLFGLCAANKVVEGGTGDNVVEGGTGENVVEGGTGENVVEGGTGDNVVEGGTGNKVVEGGTGNKVVEGGTGNKVVEGGTGNKVVEGGTGNKGFGVCSNKVVEGGTGDTVVEGGTGNKVVEGGTGNKVVEGGTGNKVVEGGTGNKVVEGGTGDKVVEGGTGDKRATFMGTFEGIFECGTLSGFYTGPNNGGNSMFVEFTAPRFRSLRCATPVAIQ